MKREDAIDYLKRKGQLVSNKYDPPEPEPEELTEEQAIKQDEEKIEKVMKKGKIYGDPMVVLNE